MHLILLSTERLARQYGAAAVARLQRVVDALAAARRGAGLATARLAPEEGLAQLRIPPADGGDPEAVRAQLADLAGALARRGRALESVLIIGGPATIPFYPVPNPMVDDDGPIPADFPYGALRPDEYLMDWAVGRLPAGDDDDPRPLLRLIALAARRHRGGGVAPARAAFGYSAAAWRSAAAAVYGLIDDPARLHLAPPLTADSFDRAALAEAQLVFCNLHGVPARPTWYGEATGGRSRLVVALRPQDLAERPLAATALFCAGCYGAYSPAYDLGKTIAMQAMLQGAACFVGATALAYGPAALPLLGADLLAYHFFRAAREPGMRAGAALRLARERTLGDTLRHQGFIDDDDAKTLIQFVLYGDPSLVIGV